MRKNIYLKRSVFILSITLAILLITASVLFLLRCSKSPSSSSSSSSSTSTTVEETTTSEQVPSDIKEMITKADTYFDEGQFAEAVSAYRSIKPAVEKNTSISDSLKQIIIKSYSINFEDSKIITEAARMHFGNSMQLEYEKRIDEAIKELEEALKIYPKYQDAIDKLDSIKSLYKLK